MTRRWTLLAGALALSLAAPQAASATSRPPAALATPDPSAAALRDLRADADGPVSVSRDATGAVGFVRSTDGEAMVDSDASTPRAAAQEQLADYGDAFGIDGTTSKAEGHPDARLRHRWIGRARRPGRRRRPRLRWPGRDEPRR